MAAIATTYRLPKILANRRTEDLIAAASRVAPTKGITNNHVPIIPLLPTVDINLPITAVTLKVITTGTIKGSINASPGTAHGTVIGAIRIERG